MDQKKSKIILSVIVAMICVMALVLLGRTMPGAQRSETKLPKLGSEPIYVTLTDGEAITRTYSNPAETLEVSSIEVLLLNIDDKTASDGKDKELAILVQNASGEQVAEVSADILAMTSGEWYKVPASFIMEKGETYSFTFTANGCDPYFLAVNGYEPGISLGFDVITDKSVTYGEALYFSIPLVILIALLVICYLLCPSVFTWLKAGEGASKIFSPVFMVLLFITLCLKIYQASYVDGVYISADSDGYMREAVNLAAGNGFSYEGIAGYKSHFANWPIIYPAMIALVMVITGMNAYLASKIVAMIVIAATFVVLYVVYKDKAWIYSLAFTNIGFITMCYYTWSEIPFVLFLLLFSICFSRIIKDNAPAKRDYIFLALTGIMAFLTRYFGIYLWFMVGPYWIYILVKMLREKDESQKKAFKGKLIGIFASGCSFVIVAFSYLLMNKKLNGYPTGVSRGTWWDDYVTLTDDLFKSLVTEVFNVFLVDVPEVISSLSVKISALFVFLVIGLITYCVVSAKKKDTLNLVLVVNAAVYYVIFIVVRYRSSMDTFYFRFFAPATVLLVMGLVGIFIDNGIDKKRLRAFAILAAGVVIVSLVGLTDKAQKWSSEQKAYDILTGTWDHQYAEIPNKSVIIWNSMDYRSTWYRPDVYSGELFGDDTWDSLSARYSASTNICIKKEDAKVLIDSGDYDESILGRFKEAIASSGDEDKYIVISLE